jgi:AraC family transcriptional regulator
MAMSASEIFWLKDVQPSGTVFQTRYRNSNLTLARFSHDGFGERLYEAEANDAVVAIIHISRQPALNLHFGGKHQHQGHISDTSFNFADLSTGPQCKIARPMDNFHLHIPRAALDDLAEEAGSPRIDRLHAPDGWDTTDLILESLKQTVLAATGNPGHVSQLFVDHMILALHTHCAGTYGGMRDAQRQRVGVLAPWQTRRAKELIAANLSKELSLTEIATECSLSTAHFSRAFKASTGTTPHGWLQTCRVQCAEELMRNSDLPLADIALQCGFADQSHFTRVFARIAGDTPGAWRRFRWAA